MLLGVLMHVMTVPGVTLEELCDKYNPILQPVTLADILEVRVHLYSSARHAGGHSRGTSASVFFSPSRWQTVSRYEYLTVIQPVTLVDIKSLLTFVLPDVGRVRLRAQDLHPQISA